MTDEELNEAIEYNLRHLEHDYSIEEELEETMKCLKETQQELQRKDNIIKDIKEYVNYLVIFNQTINGKFSETQWGQDILELIEENNENRKCS